MKKEFRGEGWCITCDFAKSIGFADTPSGKYDGVQCTSQKYAINTDKEEGTNEYKNLLKDYGVISLYRLEVLDEDSRCPYWKQRKAPGIFSRLKSFFSKTDLFG